MLVEFLRSSLPTEKPEVIEIDMMFMELFGFPALLAVVLGVSVSLIAKNRGRESVPIAMLVIWVITVPIYLLIRDPAPLWMGEDLTLKWDISFSIAVALVLFIVALPIWYMANNGPLSRLLTTVVIVSLAAGYFFVFANMILICTLFGVCDP